MARHGMEMAINTLVVMILGIVILGGGILLVWNLVGKGTKLGNDITGQQKDAIEGLMRQGQLVAVYPVELRLEPGESDTVALGIQNRLSAPGTFSVNVACKAEAQPGNVCPVNLAVLEIDPPQLAPNQQYLVPIIVAPNENTPADTYTFIVTVTNLADGLQYDQKRFFKVVVK